jgi:hypothetical protein
MSYISIRALVFRFIQDDTYKYEGNKWKQAATFTSSTDCNGAYCGLENKLEKAEQYCRNATNWLGQYSSVEGIGEITKYCASSTVGQSISNKEPLNSTSRYREYRGHYGGESIGSGTVP